MGYRDEHGNVGAWRNVQNSPSASLQDQSRRETLFRLGSYLATHLLQIATMTYGYVYLLCNRKNGTLYLGVTTDLYGRLQQHKSHHNPKSFTAQYDVTRLVWFERYDLVSDAIAREKTMKGWPRQWKINTIERENPNWDELVLNFDD